MDYDVANVRPPRVRELPASRRQTSWTLLGVSQWYWYVLVKINQSKLRNITIPLTDPMLPENAVEEAGVQIAQPVENQSTVLHRSKPAHQRGQSMVLEYFGVSDFVFGLRILQY